KVGSDDGTKSHDVVVGSAVTHDPYRLNGKENGKCLRGLLIPARGVQFFNEDIIRQSKQICIFLLDFTENTHPKARARERMAINHIVRQAEGNTELSYFILEQFAKRFQQLQMQGLWQTADIVVTLNGMCLLSLGAGRFDDIRINRTLCQPLRLRQLSRLFLEYMNKLTTDYLTFSFRICDTFKFIQEPLTGIHMDHPDTQISGEGLHYLFSLIQSQ